MHTEKSESSDEGARTIAGRLRRFLDYRHDRITDFTQRSGLPYRSVLKYLAGQSTPSAEALARFALAGVNVHWLLTGKVAPLWPTDGREYEADDMPFLADQEFCGLALEEALLVTEKQFEKFYSDTSRMNHYGRSFVANLYTNYLVILMGAARISAHVMDLRAKNVPVREIVRVVSAVLESEWKAPPLRDDGSGDEGGRSTP